MKRLIKPVITLKEQKIENYENRNYIKLDATSFAFLATENFIIL
jgi:hypothetical protein